MFIILANLVVDLLYAVIDPRVRLGVSGSDDAVAGAPAVPAPRPFLDVRDLRVRFPPTTAWSRPSTGCRSPSSAAQAGDRGGVGVGQERDQPRDHGPAPAAREITGEIWLDGEQLVGADPERVRQLRGRRMAMIFQDPLSALHPYYTVGAQIVEAYRLHQPDASKKAAREHAVDLLGRVGIPQPTRGSTTTRTSSPAACGSAR